MADKQRRSTEGDSSDEADNEDGRRAAPPSKKAKLARSNSAPGSSDGAGLGAKAKELHSQVEKRRRDKLVYYINELAGALPMVMSSAVKPDKLFILKQAVRHMTALQEGDSSDPASKVFLNDNDERSMVLEATGGFSYTLQCGSQQMSEVSSSVYNVLGFTKGSMNFQPFFNFVHEEDIKTVKQQLTPPPLSAFTEKSDEAGNTEKPTLPPGLQRRFYCRMRRSNISLWLNSQGSSSKSLPNDSFILCKITGFFRVVSDFNVTKVEGDGTLSPENVEFAALVSSISLPFEAKKVKEDMTVGYVARWDITGIFNYVENCVEELIGYSASELLGKSAYTIVHPDDVLRLMTFHQKLLSGHHQLLSPRYRIRTTFNCWFWCQMVCAPVKNPWSKHVEFIIARTEIIQTMPPIPMRMSVESESLLAPGHPQLPMAGFPSLEFDRQGSASALADLLAITDTAARPFTSDAQQKPPALTSESMQAYYPEPKPFTDQWSIDTAGFNPESQQQLPNTLSLDWAAPPLLCS